MKKQSNIFNKLYDQIVNETSMAGAGGVFGDSPDIGTHGGAVGNSDWYASGDARNIFGAGGKKSKKKCKKCKKNQLMPLLRRNLKI